MAASSVVWRRNRSSDVAVSIIAYWRVAISGISAGNLGDGSVAVAEGQQKHNQQQRGIENQAAACGVMKQWQQ